MAKKGIVFRESRKGRQLVSIDLPELMDYLESIPAQADGRYLFELEPNRNEGERHRVSHFLIPLTKNPDRAEG